jgi:hypothetical protein
LNYKETLPEFIAGKRNNNNNKKQILDEKNIGHETLGMPKANSKQYPIGFDKPFQREIIMHVIILNTKKEPYYILLCLRVL